MIRGELTPVCLGLIALLGCGSPEAQPPATERLETKTQPTQPAVQATLVVASDLKPSRTNESGEFGASNSESPAAEPRHAERTWLEVLQSDPQPGQRRAAIDRYADSGKGLEPLLLAVASDPDPLVRRWAALALQRQARSEHSSAIGQAAAAEPDPKLRLILEQALRESRRKKS